jgi:hypothetical protein
MPFTGHLEKLDSTCLWLGVGGGVLTVRFTFRGGIIRIFGAGYWRKGKRIYEQTNPIH